MSLVLGPEQAAAPKFRHDPMEEKMHKINGHEPVLINHQDADARGITDGDTVRLFNDRGACLAGARVSDAVREGVIVLATGAWFDPVEPGVPGSLDRHGNPNTLTRDAGTSKLAQACSAGSTLVQVERVITDIQPAAFEPPEIVDLVSAPLIGR